MANCHICLQDRTRLKFSTRRMKICRWCVTTLNREAMTVSEAEARRAAALHSYLFARYTGYLSSVDAALREKGDWGLRTLDDFVERIRAGGFSRQCGDVRDQSVEIKIIRAWKKGLILPGRQYTAYPKNWPFTAAYIKHLDKERCNRCRKSRSDDPDLILHAHHIVHRSWGGSNNRKNLVTLCLGCHQKQHPDVVITMHGGEPEGVYSPPEDLEPSASSPQVATANAPSPVTAPPRSFDRELALQVAGRQAEANQASPQPAQVPELAPDVLPKPAAPSQRPPIRQAIPGSTASDPNTSNGCAIVAVGFFLIALVVLVGLMGPNPNSGAQVPPAQVNPALPVAPSAPPPPAALEAEDIPPASPPEIGESSRQPSSLSTKSSARSRMSKTTAGAQVPAEALPEEGAQSASTIAQETCPPHTTQVAGKCCVGSVRDTRGEIKAMDPSHCFPAPNQ